MTPSTDIHGLLADAYREAALAGLNMRQVTEALESVRAAALSTAVAVDIAQALSAVVAATVETEALCAILARLRASVVTHKIDDELSRLRELWAFDQAASHAAWLEAIAQAMCAYYVDVADRFACAEIGEERRAEKAELLAGIAMIRRSRWRSGAALYARLGMDERVSAFTRARLLAILAGAEVTLRGDREIADRYLAQAEALGPAEYNIPLSRGLLHELDREKPEMAATAAACFEQADAQANGRAAFPLIKLGDLQRYAGNLTGAEQHYRRAAACALGPVQAYTSLIELAGHPTLFAERRSHIEALVRRAALLADDVGDTYGVILAAAAVMRENQARDEFMVWIERAIAADPERSEAYLHRGYVWLDIDDYDKASADFGRATELAPENPDGWWGKANIAEARKDWAGLQGCAMEVLLRAPDWAETIKPMLENAAAVVGPTDPMLARGFYETLRATIGARYEAEMRNLLGILDYNHSNYSAAAEYFRVAVRAEPDNPNFIYNLAATLEQVEANKQESDFSEAMECAQAALDHDPQSYEYRTLRDRIFCRQQYVARFGVAAKALTPSTGRPNILLEPRLFGIIIEEDRLRPSTDERMNSLFEMIYKKTGFRLGEIGFARWIGQDVPPANRSRSRSSASASVFDDAEAQPEDVLSAIEQEILSRLPELFGH